MTVATFTQPNYLTQSASAYKAALDAAIAVLATVGGDYACHAKDTPDMQVLVDAGQLFLANSTLISNAQQTSATIVAPVSNPRIDRIVINDQTGVVSVITGSEAASPTAPAITAGTRPIAQILLQTSSTVIANSMITDERVVSTFDVSTFIRTLLDDANAAAARATLGAAGLGANTFTGTQTHAPTTGEANLVLNNVDNSNVAGLTIQHAGSTKWRIRTGPSSGNTNLVIEDTVNSTIRAIFTAGGGLIVGSPTGGDLGANTLNVQGIIGASGGQIQFPATQNASADANTLDDYEKGTWTPSLGGTATYTAQTASYIKIGILVFIRGYLSVSTIGTGSTNTLSGLPFTNPYNGQAISVGRSANLATAVVSIMATVAAAATTISFNTRTAANAASGTVAVWGNNTEIEFSGCYST